VWVPMERQELERFKVGALDIDRVEVGYASNSERAMGKMGVVAANYLIISVCMRQSRLAIVQYDAK